MASSANLSPEDSRMSVALQFGAKTIRVTQDEGFRLTRHQVFRVMSPVRTGLEGIVFFENMLRILKKANE